MKNIDLINYLSQFSDDGEIGLFVVRPNGEISWAYPISLFWRRDSPCLGVYERGNSKEEDFIRFQKCYEELTRNGGLEDD